MRTPLTGSPYQDESDLQAMTDLLAVSRPADCQDEHPSASSLYARTGRNEGFTDPVATHPGFQQRGLARALLLTGLRLLRERGVDWAVLGTLSDNAAMQRVAQSVGFHVAWERLWFVRPLLAT